MKMKLFCLVSCFVLFVFSSVSFGGDDFCVIQNGGATRRGIRITDLSICPKENWNRGTMLYSILLKNPNSDDEEIEWWSERGASREWSVPLHGKVRVAAGGSYILSIPRPPANGGGGVFVEFRDSSGMYRFYPRVTPYHIGGNYHSDDSFFASSHYAGAKRFVGYASTSLNDHLFLALLEKKHPENKKGDFPDKAEFELGLVRAIESARPFPGDWRHYAPYHICIICERDLDTIDSAARAALADYAFSGGVVLFLGNKDILWKVVAESFKGIETGVVSRGYLSRCGGYPYGLGSVLVWNCMNPSNLNEGSFSLEQRDFLRRTISDGASFFERRMIREKSSFVQTDLGADFVRKPSFVFVFVALAFAIISGPLLWWVLSRRDKRIYILWILPLISFGFSAAVLISYVLGEGVTPSLNSESLTLIYGKSGKAVTIGGMAVYSPVTVGKGFYFGQNSDICPLYGCNGSIECEPNRLRYGGNWLGAREQSAFAVRRVDNVRERLEITKAEDGSRMTVVNGLGVTIKKIHLWDDEGKLWTTDALPLGASVGLRHEVAMPREEVLRIVKFINQEKTSLTIHGLEREFATMSSGSLLRMPILKNCYFAEYEGDSPFLEDVLEGRYANRNKKGAVFCSFGDEVAIDVEKSGGER